MRNVLFLMRVSFICNVCLLVSWLSKYFPLLPAGVISSTVIVLGIFLSFILNISINLVLLILLFQHKPVISLFPRWLIIINFLFLIVQLILLLR